MLRALGFLGRGGGGLLVRAFRFGRLLRRFGELFQLPFPETLQEDFPPFLEFLFCPALIHRFRFRGMSIRLRRQSVSGSAPWVDLPVSFHH